MQKSNIRSFRYTDQVREILENSPGNGMNDKFDRLVNFCFGQVHEVERRLKELNAEIAEKQKMLANIEGELGEMYEFVYKFESTARSFGELTEKARKLEAYYRTKNNVTHFSRRSS